MPTSVHLVFLININELNFAGAISLYASCGLDHPPRLKIDSPSDYCWSVPKGARTGCAAPVATAIVRHIPATDAPSPTQPNGTGTAQHADNIVEIHVAD